MKTISEGIGAAGQLLDAVPKYLLNCDYTSNSFINAIFLSDANKQYSTAELKKLSASADDTRVAYYQDSLELGEIPDSRSKIEEYLNKRQLILSSFNVEVETSDDTKNILRRYEGLNDFLKKIGRKHKAGDVQDAAQDERTKTIDALKKQHKSDRAVIEEKISSRSGPTADPTAIKALKDCLMELDEHHKQMKALEDGLNDDTKKIHQAVSIERERAKFFSRIYTLSPDLNSSLPLLNRFSTHKDMRTILNEIRLNKPHDEKDLSELGISSTYSGDFKNITIDEFIQAAQGRIVTPTGAILTATKSGDGYQVSLSMPSAMFGLYSATKDTKQDWLFLAQFIRATGKETINCNIKHADMDVALALARQAYEACLETGFEPYAELKEGQKDRTQNIIITINNVQYTYEKLFVNPPVNSHSRETEATHAKGASMRSERIGKLVEKQRDIKGRKNDYIADYLEKHPEPATPLPATIVDDDLDARVVADARMGGGPP